MALGEHQEIAERFRLGEKCERQIDAVSRVAIPITLS
jgi:hypothetical protein